MYILSFLLFESDSIVSLLLRESPVFSYDCSYADLFLENQHGSRDYTLSLLECN